MSKRLIPSPIAAVVALAIAAPSAEAGEYRQHTCKLPDGSPAATDGWGTDPTSAGFSATELCASHASLRLDMQRGLAAPQAHVWRWRAPLGTKLSALKLYRSLRLADASGTATPEAKISVGSLTLDEATTSALGNGVREAGTPIPWDHASNIVGLEDNPALADADVVVSLGCLGFTSGAACPSSGTVASELHVHAAIFTITDATAPSVFSVAGSLTTGGVKRGVEQLTYSATDAGAGIYRTLVRVDGSTVAATTPDANGGKCADAVPANASPYDFQHGVPCPLAVSSVQVPLDTRTLGDGVHVLEVDVEDASGNRSAALEPTAITVDNTPAPTPSNPGSSPGSAQPTTAAPAATSPPVGSTNGIGGGPSARLSVAVLESRQRVVHVAHDRSVTLSGRLVTQAGTPIADATVEIQARRASRNAAMTPLATVRTDAAGGFRYVLRPGPSRVVRFGYRARVGDAAFSTSVDVDVRVKAGLSFKLSHSTLRNGKSIGYSGRVSGQTKRPLVQIQVRSQGRWVNVCVVRAHTNGTYSCRYRFRRTFSPTTYTFRAFVKTQEGLPYETTASATKRLRVRP